MKKTLNLIVLTCFVLLGRLAAQQCPSTTLTTQAEVDAFNCTEITGNLIVEGDDITNLNGLSELISVSGNFLIRNNSNLTTANLPNLELVDAGALRISSNPLLTSVSFPNLVRVGNAVFNFLSSDAPKHSLYVNSNASLETLDGAFPLLNRIGNNLLIANNGSLLSINDFFSLERTGWNLQIEFNNELTTIGGFDALEVVGASVDIDSNPLLMTILGMQSMRRTGQQFLVRNLPVLTTAEFQSLDTVGTNLLVQNNALLEAVSFPELRITNAGALRLTSNTSLTDISFPNLVRVGNAVFNFLSSDAPKHSLYVNSNASLEALDGAFPLLNRIGNNLFIEGNESLVSIEGFPSLERTGWNFQVEFNEELASINGFGALETVGGSVDIDSNPSLTSVSGMQSMRRTGQQFLVRNLPVLTTAEFQSLDTVGTNLLVQNNALLEAVSFPELRITNAGALRLTSNTSLTDISFPNLVRVGNAVFNFLSSDAPKHSLYVNSNASLEALDGAFPLLNRIGNNLFIEGNESLVSIEGFPSLERTGWNFQVEFNEELASINGFGALETVGGSVDIDSNPSLTSVSGMQSMRRTGQQFLVRNLPVLTTAEFQSLDTVGTNLLMQNNALLEAVSFPELRITNAGALRLTSNTSLTDISFPNLVRVGNAVFNFLSSDAPKHSLYVNSNASLETLDGAFPILKRTGNNIFIENNDQLLSIGGFGSLDTIGNSIVLRNNPLLAIINGFPSLISLNQGGFAVTGNTTLDSITTFNQLQSVAGNFTVTNNPELFFCCGMEPILTNTLNIGGSVNIQGNQPECDSIAAILDFCEDLPTQTWYQDADNDGFGDPAMEEQSITQPPGFVDNNDDCDDTNPDINPNAPEICDGLDNNCDGDIDEGVLTEFYPDVDGDGFGDGTAAPTLACTAPPNFVADNTDNCPDIFNPDQVDSNGNGIGDACEPPPCPPGDLILTSQAEVDAFPANCTIIDGDLIINGDDITDLSNLLSLQEITGTVLIGDTIPGNIGNDILTNLEGLNNITTIGDDLIICQNPVLISLNGFSSLTEVVGDILVKNCIALSSFNLFFLSNVGGNITLFGLPALIEIGPFNINFTSFGGTLFIDGTGISSLGGFSGWTFIGGDLFILNNPLLTQIDFPNLIQLIGCLHIINNTLVIDLSGLDNLTSIGGDIRIIDMDEITNVDNLGNLTSVSGSLIISENNLLENLDGLANLTQVLDSLVVTGNPALSECCGLFPLLSSGNLPPVIIIENNLAGCNSVAEILATCPPCPDADGDTICDDIDNCPNTPNPDQTDSDSDGFGLACDCNDADAGINPDATEVCDGQDNNCDGDVDEGLLTAFYPDGDGDGFGDENATPTLACSAPPNFVDNNDDCDDGFATVNPNAVEIIDGTDNDCDGIIDNGPVPPGDCDDIEISTAGGELTITGLDLAPGSFVQIFDPSFNTLFQCYNNCGASLNFNFGNGTFHIIAKYLESDGTERCTVEADVTITGATNPGAGICGNIDYMMSPNLLTIGNVDASLISEVQVFDLEWDSIFYCFQDCGIPASIPLAAGSYQVLFKYFNPDYSLNCERLDTVIVNDFLIAQNSQFEFNVAKHDEHTELVWSHKNMENVVEYIVEKSADGTDFEIIETWPAEDGLFETYQSYDLRPYDGKNHYRIGLLNDVGEIAYSEIRTVEFPVFAPYTIFPNPANSFAKIDLSRNMDRNVKLAINNNLGQPIKSFSIGRVSSKYYQMDLRDVPEGYYWVWVFPEGKRAVAMPMMVGKR